jgi:hypothetical protein
MTLLVTVCQAKEHLRVDFDTEDDDIELKIHAASAAILDYLDDARYDFTDTSGELTADVPYTVQAATLLMVGDLYKNREPTATDAVDSKFGYGYLPRAVLALLYPLRTPPV